MSEAAIPLQLMKVLATKHFPLKEPRRKVKLELLVTALDRMGTKAPPMSVFESMCELKGRGYVNTIPKIILKEEALAAEFEVWLTPLGRTELQKKLEAEAS